MFTRTESFDRQVVAIAKQAGAGVAGPLNAAKVVVFTNTVALTRTTLLAALTLATYPGYAAVVPTWGAAQRNPEGDTVSDSTTCKFQQVASVGSVVLKGVAVLDSAGAVLYMAELLPGTGYPLNDDFDALEVIVEYNASRPELSKVIIL